MKRILDKTVELFVTVFYIGRFPYAQGTVASVVTLALFYWMFFVFGVRPGAHASLINSLFLLGFIASSKYTESKKDKDPKEIVIDEVVGMLLTCFCCASISVYFAVDIYIAKNTLLFMGVCFGLFRFFDIVKPFPINAIDEHVKTGLGIMLDDFVAAIYSSVVFTILLLLRQIYFIS